MTPKATLLFHGKCITLHQVETEHFVFYLGERRVGKTWDLIISLTVTRPEFLANATQIQGKALAEAHAAVQAVHRPPCDECQGEKTNPPCWKCQGRKP